MSFEPRDIQPDMAETTEDLAITTHHHHATPDAPVKAIIAGVLCVLAMWGGAIAAFGLPGLYIPAVIAVPFLFGMLVLISKG
ncbi:hypothetical protein [Shimia biformata]|uniref:hypothetical protein n=1 Tax=Shimia biformata TaxID=1294299 RepID=UPI0019500CE6|nr:hypothetical protein [Shimia biformata]